MTITIPELRDAIMRVTGLVIIRGTVNLSLEQIQAIIEKIPEVTGDFPITSVCRDDLAGYGFDVEKITNDQMKELADKMEDDYCEQMFHESMTIIARDCMGLPKIGDSENESN